MCKKVNETKDHLFLCCPFAAATWSHLLKEFGVFWVWPRSCHEVYQHVFGAVGLDRRRELWNAAVMAICWSLWLETIDFLRIWKGILISFGKGLYFG